MSNQDRIDQLQALLSMGVITQEEYDRRAAEVLGEEPASSGEAQTEPLPVSEAPTQVASPVSDETKPLPASNAAAKSRFCTKCGTPLQEGATFCTNCGDRVDAASVASDEPARPLPHTPEPAAPERPLPYYSEQPQQNYVPPKPKKGAARGLIIGIIIALLAAIVAVGIGVKVLILDPADEARRNIQSIEHAIENSSRTQPSTPSVEEQPVADDDDLDLEDEIEDVYTKDVSAKTKSGATLHDVVRVDEDGFVLGNSDYHLYTKSEIQSLGLTDAELNIARNEIYARTGYNFKNSGLQTYFDSCDWYVNLGKRDNLPSGSIADKNARLLLDVAKESSPNSPWLNLAEN